MRYAQTNSDAVVLKCIETITGHKYSSRGRAEQSQPL
jgi:hypothetical protein